MLESIYYSLPEKRRLYRIFIKKSRRYKPCIFHPLQVENWETFFFRRVFLHASWNRKVVPKCRKAGKYGYFPVPALCQFEGNGIVFCNITYDWQVSSCERPIILWVIKKKQEVYIIGRKYTPEIIHYNYERFEIPMVGTSPIWRSALFISEKVCIWSYQGDM